MPNASYPAAPRALAQEMRELARDPAARREARLFLVEGPRGVAEALDAGAVVRWIVAADDRAATKESARLLAAAARRGAQPYTMAAEKLARSAPSEKGPGLVAACELPETADDPRDALRRAAGGLVVVSWGLEARGVPRWCRRRRMRRLGRTSPTCRPRPRDLVRELGAV